MTGETPPEVVFDSTVTAEQLHFREISDTHVEFTGYPDHDSASGRDRTHLPKPVSLGVTYRNIRVAYRIVSRVRTEADSDPETSP